MAGFSEKYPRLGIDNKGGARLSLRLLCKATLKIRKVSGPIGKSFGKYYLYKLQYCVVAEYDFFELLNCNP